MSAFLSHLFCCVKATALNCEVSVRVRITVRKTVHLVRLWECVIHWWSRQSLFFINKPVAGKRTNLKGKKKKHKRFISGKLFDTHGSVFELNKQTLTFSILYCQILFAKK